MHHYSFFVYRAAAPASFQLVSISFGDVWRSSSATHALPSEWSTGDWFLTESNQLSQLEWAAMGTDLIEKFSFMMLVNREHPELQYRICAPYVAMNLPRRGRGEITTFEGQQRPVIDNVHLVSDGLLEQFHNWRNGNRTAAFSNVTLDPEAPPRPPAPPAPPTITNILPPLPPLIRNGPRILPWAGANASASAAPAPAPLPTTNMPPPLSEFAAKLIAKATVAEEGAMCPVTMDTLVRIDAVAVAPCGHVVSAAVHEQLSKCPICRQECRWTVVKM